jgi:diguanylate cyclase (GGDEF)-like protein
LSVRARLIVLALILVVPFMADRVRVLESSRASRAHAISLELLNSSRQSADAQREMISSIEALLKSVAYSYSLGDSSDRGCAIMRASLRVELPWITSLSVARGDGKILCSTLPNYDGLNLSDRSYFQQALTSHQLILSSYVLSKLTGQPALLAAYSAPAPADDPQIVVVAGVSLKWMVQLLEGLRDRPGVTATLVDADGIVLASEPGDSESVGRRIDDPALMKALSTDGSGSTSIVSADGKRRAVSFTRIPGTGVQLLVSVDETRILGQIDREIRKAYWQLAVVTALVLFGAWLVGEQLILRPIRALTMMATKLGEGDLSARSDRSSLPPEFAQLATALNVMASQLGERERELRASNNQLAVLASADAVSGLANRRGFDSRLAFEWIRAEHNDHALCLMMIDIDHFKLYNDTYGHLEGDTCLRLVGERLSAIADEVKGFAARYGGEEFSLMIAAIDSERAAEIAERVRLAIEELRTPHTGAPLGYVTVSVGIALAQPGRESDPTALIEAADAGLYAAKRRGRNTVVEHAAIRITDRLAVPAESIRFRA